MSSKSKILPLAALAVAITFLWCYPTFTGSGFSGLAGNFQEPSQAVTVHMIGDNTACEVCQSAIAKTSNSDSSSNGRFDAPVNISSTGVFPPATLSGPAADSSSSKLFALHHASLFHQAILIRT